MGTAPVTLEQVAKTLCEELGAPFPAILACGIPVVMSRPVVGNLYAEDEWIDIASMMFFCEMYRLYLERNLN